MMFIELIKIFLFAAVNIFFQTIYASTCTMKDQNVRSASRLLKGLSI